MGNEFLLDAGKLRELSKDILRHDVLANISQYNEQMTLSQVVRFFERNGLAFTNTMIQNYVRVGVVPPPVEKRYYTKNHLILLTLIHHLKEIYSLDDIKRLIQPVAKDANTFDDDLIDMAALYKIYEELYREAIDDWGRDLPALVEKVRERVDRSGGVSEAEKETVYFFVTVLTLMVQSIAAKQLARLMLDSFAGE